MLEIKTVTDVQRLIDEGLPEGLSLEYKSSLALRKTGEARAELVKDVTAFANSAGGQIIYGVSETRGLHLKLDEGTDAREISADWISQVLETSASPRVQGISIDTIRLGDAASHMVMFVLTIPAATVFAPHQNSLDKRYYRRFEARSVPMHDYEIRDLLRRGRSPELRVKLAFADGSMSQKLARPNQALELSPLVENVSSEPALYCLFDFLFDKRLILLGDAGLRRMNDFQIDDHKFHKLQKTTIAPNDFPLLWGTTMSFGPPNIEIAVPPEHFGANENFLIGYSALTSGFNQTRFALLSLQENVISIGEFFASYGASTRLEE